MPPQVHSITCLRSSLLSGKTSRSYQLSSLQNLSEFLFQTPILRSLCLGCKNSFPVARQINNLSSGTRLFFFSPLNSLLEGMGIVSSSSRTEVTFVLPFHTLALLLALISLSQWRLLEGPGQKFGSWVAEGTWPPARALPSLHSLGPQGESHFLVTGNHLLVPEIFSGGFKMSLSSFVLFCFGSSLDLNVQGMSTLLSLGSLPFVFQKIAFIDFFSLLQRDL